MTQRASIRIYLAFLLTIWIIGVIAFGWAQGTLSFLAAVGGAALLGAVTRS